MSEENVPNLKVKNGRDSQSHKDQNNSRRKFIIGAASVTPIVFTVASRPVWARSCSMSGQLSGNLSDQDGEICSGEGCSPGFWTNRGYYKGYYHRDYPADMKFYDAFGRDAFPGKSLHDVASMEGERYRRKERNHYDNMLRQLGFHAVAALQNAATPLKYELDVATVIRSFQVSYDRDKGTGYILEETKNTFEMYNSRPGSCPL